MKEYPYSYLSFPCAAIIIVVTVMILFPGAPLLIAIPGLLACGTLSYLLMRRLGIDSQAARHIITAAWLLLSIGYVLNIWYFTTVSGGSLSNPVLNNFDANLSWQQMSCILEGDSLDTNRMIGYGRLLAFLAYITGGPDIAVLILFNVAFTLLTIVLTGAAAARLSDLDNRTSSAAWAMGMMTAICYFMAEGTILIKDSSMCLCSAATIYALSCLTDIRKSYTAAWTVLFIAALMAFLVRPLLPPILALAAIATAFVTKRSKVAMICVYVLFCVGLWGLSNYMEEAPQVITQNNVSVEIDTCPSDRLKAYNAVSPDYNNLPIAKKIIRLPFSLAVQYLTPLPWAFKRDIVFGPSVAYAHVSYPWYIVGGIILFFLFFTLRKAPRPLTAIVLFGVFATVITAFFTGGTISRYCLLWLPALVPGGAWIMGTGRWRSKSFKIWGVIYAIAIIIALAVVFHYLNAYTPQGWEAS